MEDSSKISNQKFRDVFGQKATMVKAKDLESEIGHPVGGVCPFALKDNVRLYFDETLKKHQVVFTTAGTEMTTVELTLDELENSVKDFEWINVAKNRIYYLISLIVSAILFVCFMDSVIIKIIIGIFFAGLFIYSFFIPDDKLPSIKNSNIKSVICIVFIVMFLLIRFIGTYF